MKDYTVSTANAEFEWNFNHVCASATLSASGTYISWTSISSVKWQPLFRHRNSTQSSPALTSPSTMDIFSKLLFPLAGFDALQRQCLLAATSGVLSHVLYFIHGFRDNQALRIVLSFTLAQCILVTFYQLVLKVYGIQGWISWINEG